MASSACLNSRIILNITPLLRSTSERCPNRLPSPKAWIRTITSSSNRRISSRPLVSFGRENDGVIAPYLEKPGQNSKLRQRSTGEAALSDTTDDYQIDGFVDRSEPDVRRSEFRKSSKPEILDATPEGAIRPSNKRKQTRPSITDGRLAQGLKTRGKQYSSFVADEIPTNTRAERPRHRNLRLDANATTSSKPPLTKKVTEDVDKWAIQKNALREKFKHGWQPRKKLSPDAQEGIRGLHEQDPITYSTDVLANQFKQSPEAIRRILKSKWQSKQSPEKLQERRERWAKRHDRIWDAKAEIGQRPPRRRDKEVEDPDKFEQDLERRRILGEI